MTTHPPDEEPEPEERTGWRRYFYRFLVYWNTRDRHEPDDEPEVPPGDATVRSRWSYLRRRNRRVQNGVHAPIPFITPVLGGLQVFFIPEIATGTMALPPRHRDAKPEHRLWNEIGEHDAESVARSRLSWLSLRYALIILAADLGLGITLYADHSVSAVFIGVAFWLGAARFAWSYLYAYWWGSSFDYTQQKIYMHTGVFHPKSLGSVGGESISEVLGEPYTWSNWFGLDVGVIRVATESREELLVFKHVPNWSRVFRAIQGIDEAGGQSVVQAHTRLSAMGAYMRGDITREDVAEELGEVTAANWARKKESRRRPRP